MSKKLSPEEFVLRALARLPAVAGGKQRGVRRDDLVGPFQKYFSSEGLDATINSLVNSGKIVAISLAWTRKNYRSYLTGIRRLTTFPENQEPSEHNPMLYLREMIPRRITRRVLWADTALDHILSDT